MIKSVARKVLPVDIRRKLRHVMSKEQYETRLRRRMFATPPRTSGVERCFDYSVRINDGPNFYILYKGKI